MCVRTRARVCDLANEVSVKYWSTVCLSACLHVRTELQVKETCQETNFFDVSPLLLVKFIEYFLLSSSSASSSSLLFLLLLLIFFHLSFFKKIILK